MNYLFLTHGFEEIEAVETIDILRRAELPLLTVSVEEALEVKGAHDVVVKADILLTDREFADANILILPGGTLRLGEFTKLNDLLLEHNKKGGLIAAICAAPSILGKLGILAGRAATCYPGFEKYLIGAQVIDSLVVKSENIITGKGPGCTKQFALELVRTLCGEEKTSEVAKAMIV